MAQGTSSNNNNKLLTGYFPLALSIALSVIVFLAAPFILQFKTFGYVGIFVISLASSATVFLPAPGWLLILALSATLDPITVGLVAGVGAGLGELTGYFAGFGAEHLLRKREGDRYHKIKEFMKKNGFLTVFGLSALPLGIIDIAGVIAGATRYNLYKFLFAAILGKIVKFFLMAYLLHEFSNGAGHFFGSIF